MPVKIIKGLLEHPETRGIDLDDPETTSCRRAIIKGKGLLSSIYREWYRGLRGAVPEGNGGVLELGSGAGFFKETEPDAITSEVFYCDHIDTVIDAQSLPFPDGSLKAIVMVDVFHHIPDVGAFLEEASRCLKMGGVVSMIEPWITDWSRFIYKNFHHEPIDEAVVSWSFPSQGPLSGANSALPWIVFERDRAEFEKRFKHFSCTLGATDYAFSYLASGGCSMRSLSPGWTYGLWRKLDRLFCGQGLFRQITLTKSNG